jgi:predicted dehydrogenase
MRQPTVQQGSFHMTSNPVVFGCAGLGGFAGTICDRLLTHSQLQNPIIRLAAVCDPEPERNPQRVSALREAGVKVFQHFHELLSEAIEAVWLPLPIDLHRPFTEQALAAGKAVMCEKPAAGCVQEVDAMIAARDRSNLHVAIGFQDVYQPTNIALKQRLMSGELGRPKSATLLACWPRGDRYYRRNTWAGKLQRNGAWVLDSPASNALSHFIHLVMYVLGRTPAEAARPLAIEAELYRANAIENYDTCCMRIKLAGDIDFVVALTHACTETIEPEIEIITDRARVRLLAGRSIEIRRESGGDNGVESISQEGGRYGNVIGAFSRRLRGVADAPCGATLEMARAHVVAINGASEAAAVHDVPANVLISGTAKDGSPVRAIPDIHNIFRQCTQQRKLLHESGLAPQWARKAQGTGLDGYARFGGPKRMKVDR